MKHLLHSSLVTMTLLSSALLSAQASAQDSTQESAQESAENVVQEYDVPTNAEQYVRSAVETAERQEGHLSRDADRKPGEILALSEVEPGDRVVEFASFGQYYTTMLSNIVGPDGHVHMYDLPYTAERSEEASEAFVASHPNTEYHLVNYDDIELPDDVDVVFNILYYHDLSLNDIDVAALNEKIYDALKPGGVFLIVDHNAEPGSGTEDTESLHRIDPEIIKQQVTDAGFELVEDSDILHNPEDDHTQMVFAEDMRGLTDRSVLKFRKPAAQ